MAIIPAGAAVVATGTGTTAISTATRSALAVTARGTGTTAAAATAARTEVVTTRATGAAPVATGAAAVVVTAFVAGVLLGGSESLLAHPVREQTEFFQVDRRGICFVHGKKWRAGEKGKKKGARHGTGEKLAG